MKVFVVGSQTGYARFIKDCELVNKQENADVVIFTGGEDVTPSMYGCKKHPTTYCNSERDKAEKKAFDKVKPSQLVVGICRGLTMAHVKQGEFDGNAEMPTRSQARKGIFWKVQRLGIETRSVGNIPTRALTMYNSKI